MLLETLEIWNEKMKQWVCITVGDTARDALQKIKSSDSYLQYVESKKTEKRDKIVEEKEKKLPLARNYELALRYENAINLYRELGMEDEVRRIKLLMAKNLEYSKNYEKAPIIYEESGKWEDAGRVRKFAQIEAIKKTDALQRKQKAGRLSQADRNEIEKLHRKLESMIEKVRDMKSLSELNTLLENLTKIRSQVFVHGDYMEGGKTDISGIVQRSTIGEEKNKIKHFSFCPYCGKELDLPKTPNFCHYCNEKLT